MEHIKGEDNLAVIDGTAAHRSLKQKEVEDILSVAMSHLVSSPRTKLFKNDHAQA
jgi:hypothetical protein